jgi:hypothetical protein
MHPWGKWGDELAPSRKVRRIEKSDKIRYGL